MAPSIYLGFLSNLQALFKTIVHEIIENGHKDDFVGVAPYMNRMITLVALRVNVFVVRARKYVLALMLIP